MSEKTGEVAKSRWWPYVWIVVASAAAHLWCMGSQFYLDDLWQIRDNGTFHGDGYTEGITLRWFYVMLQAQVGVFGMSAPAIHAFNWLLHTTVALVLWRLALQLLPGRPGVALFGALLFAVHPLGSEIPNYARCQDIAWVTLFSLAACHQVLAFFQSKRWWHVPVALLMMAGAAFSKGPGMFHALMMVAAIVACCGLPMMGQGGRRRLPWLMAGVVALGVSGYLVSRHLVWDVALARAGDPRFTGHAFTLSRVFWEFCRLGFWPQGLCADHHTQETLVPAGFWEVTDTVAWVAMGSLLALTIFSLVMMVFPRTRVFGLCVGLFVGAMLIRFAYFVPEFMPEYRIYPGLPWFCLGVAVVASAAWRWLTPISGIYLATPLLILLAVISAKRSHQWHDLDVLMADVLEKYPHNARALWVLQRRDVEQGNWQAVMERHRKLPEMTRKFIKAMEDLKPHRTLPTGHHALAEVGCTCFFARAVAEVQGPVRGMMVLNSLELYMKRLGITPETNPEHWRQFHRAKAWMLYKQGRLQEAHDLLQDIAMAESRLLLKEIEAKLKQQSPDSSGAESTQ